MTKVRFSTDASADFEEIRLYLRDVSPSAEAHYRRLFGIAIRRLSLHPLIGRPRPELRPRGVRSWVIWPYLFLYIVRDDCVVLVRVVHGARNLEHLEPRDDPN